jgi:molybdopterin converting factor small subunit
VSIQVKGMEVKPWNPGTLEPYFRLKAMVSLIKIPPLFQEQLSIPDQVKVHGQTLGECLEDLIRQYPEVRSWLFDPNDLLRVLLSIKNETIWTWNTKDNLERTLDRGEEIRILAIYAGG